MKRGMPGACHVGGQHGGTGRRLPSHGHATHSRNPARARPAARRLRRRRGGSETAGRRPRRSSATPDRGRRPGSDRVHRGRDGLRVERRRRGVDRGDGAGQRGGRGRSSPRSSRTSGWGSGSAAEVADADVPEGETLVGAVVSIACDAPDGDLRGADRRRSLRHRRQGPTRQAVPGAGHDRCPGRGRRPRRCRGAQGRGTSRRARRRRSAGAVGGDVEHGAAARRGPGPTIVEEPPPSKLMASSAPSRRIRRASSSSV